MKTKIRKIFSLVLAFVMTLSMGVTAFADSASDKTGSITVKEIISGETYSAYQMFELSYGGELDETTGEWYTYSYLVKDEWKEFFTSGKGSDYIILDKNGYITDESPLFDETDNSDTMAEFAKAAMSFAESKKITPTASVVAEGTEAQFDNLPLGYYLVDTSIGSLCMLDSTTPHAEIEEKNITPLIDKFVRDATHGEIFEKEDSADIGDTLEYEIIITNVKDTDKRLIVHDRMSQGIKLIEGSIVVSYQDKTASEGSDYSVTYLENDRAFDLEFYESFLTNAGFDESTEIIITYNAKVTEEAARVNNNDVYIEYGNAQESERKIVLTDVFGFSIWKVENGEEEGTYETLDNAIFELIDSEENTITFITSGDKYTVHDKSISENYTSEIIAGKVEVFGLEAGTYTLREKKAPSGFNRLDYDIIVTIDDNGHVTFTNENGEEMPSTDNEVMIINNAGRVLIKTGGTGTIIFYAVGGLLLIGVAIAFIVRRKLKNDTKDNET